MRRGSEASGLGGVVLSKKSSWESGFVHEVGGESSSSRVPPAVYLVFLKIDNGSHQREHCRHNEDFTRIPGTNIKKAGDDPSPLVFNLDRGEFHRLDPFLGHKPFGKCLDLRTVPMYKDHFKAPRMGYV